MTDDQQRVLHVLNLASAAEALTIHLREFDSMKGVETGIYLKTAKIALTRAVRALKRVQFVLTNPLYTTDPKPFWGWKVWALRADNHDIEWLYEVRDPARIDQMMEDAENCGAYLAVWKMEIYK